MSFAAIAHALIAAAASVATIIGAMSAICAIERRRLRAAFAAGSMPVSAGPEMSTALPFGFFFSPRGVEATSLEEPASSFELLLRKAPDLRSVRLSLLARWLGMSLLEPPRGVATFFVGGEGPSLGDICYARVAEEKSDATIWRRQLRDQLCSLLGARSASTLHEVCGFRCHM